MAFRVEISAQAERDAEAILDWLLTQHTGQSGIDWFLALDHAFASLAEFPERCPIAPENTRFPFEVRQLFLRMETSHDFIPVLGQLDELIIVPLLILLALKLTPKEVIADCRHRAGESKV